MSFEMSVLGKMPAALLRHSDPPRSPFLTSPHLSDLNYLSSQQNCWLVRWLEWRPPSAGAVQSVCETPLYGTNT
uniref:Uncharacterized protein MANES_05G107100 n=1 Tax=Rhizophora mucronata TaxID=61149 RepID=A0A2P2II46_RHIMU